MFLLGLIVGFHFRLSLEVEHPVCPEHVSVSMWIRELRARGPGLDTWSGHILLFLFCLFKNGSCQLLAKICTLNTD